MTTDSKNTDDDRREQGMKVRRDVLGDAHVDRAIAGTTPDTEAFQDYVTRVAWGDIWSRPGLDRRARSIVALSTLMAAGAWEEVPMHFRAALRNGLTREELREIILQVGLYRGVPVANHAFSLLAEALDGEADDGTFDDGEDGMRDKVVADVATALDGIADGSTVLIGGFGLAGHPVALIDGLREQGAKDLTIVCNNAGNGDTGLAALLAAGRVRKVVCSFPRQSDSWVFDGLYRAGKIELEVVPQGNLAERIRAGGAGIGGFFTPTGYGTTLAEGKETREIDGTWYVLEAPIRADVALIGGYLGDRLGNLVYRKTSRNFNPVMASAATVAVAQVDRVVEVGELDPESIVTPGIFIDRVVEVGDREWLK